MEVRLGLLLFTLCCGIVLATAEDGADTEQQREKRTTADDPALTRMDRLRTAQISACLRYMPEVGCETFSCLRNVTCDIDDLYEICIDYMHNAAKLDLHGKRFTKDILKCIALGVKSRFSSSISNCYALQRMLIYVQVKCYRLHNICPVTETNMEALVSMINLQKIFYNGAYLEYVSGLFNCGDKVIDAIRRHLYAQLGPSLPIFRHLWQESCTRKSTTPATASKDINVNDETIQGGNWK